MFLRLEKWRFINQSKGVEIDLKSISEGIEELVDVSRKEIGESIRFQHSDQGAILCNAGMGLGAIAFNPRYREEAHSLVGFHRAVPETPAEIVNYYFVDDTDTLSSIEVSELLPILDVIRGVVFILEFHDYPTFLKWRPGC